MKLIALHTPMLTFLGAVAAVRLSLLSPVLADNELSVMRSLKEAYPEWQPRGIVDVGANRGGWTTNAQQLYSGVKTFMVEATPSHFGILDETKKKFENIVDFEIALLSESDGKQVDFFDLDNGFGGTGNSMFPENSHHYKGLKPDKRTTKKLDTLLKERNMDYVDYLKLDVQGAELVVLAGATETLKKATFVQLEVSVIQYNKGAACWYEVDAFLRKHGFFFYDSADYARNEGAFHTKALGQFDVLYIKPTSTYMPTWLVDNNLELCGSKSGNEVSNINSDSAALEMSSSSMSNNMVLFSLFSAFLGGYIVGKINGNKARGVGKRN